MIGESMFYLEENICYNMSEDGEKKAEEKCML